MAHRVGSRQCRIRPESGVKQTSQGHRSTDANARTSRLVSALLWERGFPLSFSLKARPPPCMGTARQRHERGAASERGSLLVPDGGRERLERTGEISDIMPGTLAKCVGEHASLSMVASEQHNARVEVVLWQRGFLQGT